MASDELHLQVKLMTINGVICTTTKHMNFHSNSSQLFYLQQLQKKELSIDQLTCTQKKRFQRNMEKTNWIRKNATRFKKFAAELSLRSFCVLQKIQSRRVDSVFVCLQIEILDER